MPSNYEQKTGSAMLLCGNDITGSTKNIDLFKCYVFKTTKKRSCVFVFTYVRYSCLIES